MAAIEGRMVFLGLLGLIDPPRPEAVTAVQDCRAAGIAIKMITGDHAATALAIARQLGLADDPRAVTGRELDDLDPAGLRRVAGKPRCSPAPARSTSCAWSRPCRPRVPSSP